MFQAHAEIYLNRFAIQPRATFLASYRPSGSYPETGLEEINGDLREADLSRSIAEKLLTLQRAPPTIEERPKETVDVLLNFL